MTDPVYETSKYKVELVHNSCGELVYVVVNIDTNVDEYETKCLPKALSLCEEFTIFLERDVHKKINYFEHLQEGYSASDAVFERFLEGVEIDGEAN